MARAGARPVRQLDPGRTRARRRRHRPVALEDRHRRPAAQADARRNVRQVFAAAVRWRYIAANPAKDAGPNKTPRKEEIEPFTPDELDAIIAELADSLRDMGIVIFAAETGLRTSEWPALERRDIDVRNPAVTVQRRFVRNQLTPYPKTERSRRRVPLTPAAIDALGPPRIDTPYLFANRYGERLRYDKSGAAGSGRRPCRPPASANAAPYHLRHTFATEALAATGMSTWQPSRLHGRLRGNDRRHLRPPCMHDSEYEALLGMLTQRSARIVPTVDRGNL